MLLPAVFLHPAGVTFHPVLSEKRKVGQKNVQFSEMPTIQGMKASVIVVLAWTLASLCGAEKPTTRDGKHVYDTAALNRCSSPYKREIVADPQVRSGQAVRFTGSGNCTTSPVLLKTI